MRIKKAILIFIGCFIFVACSGVSEDTSNALVSTNVISPALRALAQNTAVEARENFYQFISIMNEAQDIFGEDILTFDYYLKYATGILFQAFEYPAIYVDEQIFEYSRLEVSEVRSMAESMQFLAFIMLQMIEESLADESHYTNLEFIIEAENGIKLLTQAAGLLDEMANIMEEFIYTAEYMLS